MEGLSCSSFELLRSVNFRRRFVEVLLDRWLSSKSLQSCVDVVDVSSKCCQVELLVNVISCVEVLATCVKCCQVVSSVVKELSKFYKVL